VSKPVTLYSLDTAVTSGYAIFDGIDNKTIISINTGDWYFKTNPFTIDFWVNLSVDDVGDVRPVWCYGLGGTRTWFLVHTSGLEFKWYHGVTPIQYATSNMILNTQQWYHVALVRTGTNVAEANSGWHFYVDGVDAGLLKLGYLDWNWEMPNHASAAQLGRDTAIAQYFSGWVDELRVSNIARWTSDFSPGSYPSAQYATDGNTLLLMHLDVNETDSTARHVCGTGLDFDSNFTAEKPINFYDRIDEKPVIFYG